ncbi:TolC family protein [Nannocystis bainbridge]|uniref:TolC family protein n=1 Tax=Nannocystis bainbridge TaxID=2995303 RepID=A0ABT5DRG6_9BACT|nr:TolC family protein [Nannocystis bainbridge]MDC0716213.1 TolC family protein [Nannocystis bainbridge]
MTRSSGRELPAATRSWSRSEVLTATRRLGWAAAVLLVIGCAQSRFDREWVTGELADRVPGVVVGAPEAGQEPTLPVGVSLADGLDEGEAVSVALWNSPSFQADLAQLAVARADLADAGALPNPMLTMLFPLGPHQLSGYLLVPLAALAQRPARVRAAQRDVERVADSLVQTGLDLIRDVRLAHADAAAAAERGRARVELVGLWTESEKLAQARVDAGDTSRLERDAIRAEALLAADLAARAEHDAALARLRLRQLLGVTSATLPDDTPVIADAGALPKDPDGLMREALAARPDLRAAELAVEAAGKRLGLERARIFQGLLRVDGQLDAQGFHPSLGFHQIELPIFNWNQGGRARAKAELQRALWRYAQLRQQIVAEVATAELQARLAHESLTRWDEQVQTLTRTVAAATSSFRAGSDSYVVVLDANRRLQDARIREIDLRADLRRALAQLDRSVGRRLTPPSTSSSAPQGAQGTGDAATRP